MHHFKGDRRHVPDRPEESPAVVPGDPLEGGKLDVLEASPRGASPLGALTLGAYASKFKELSFVAVYYLYVLTGLLMIWLCPAHLSAVFLSVYPIGNFVSSLLVYLFYTNGRSKSVDVLAFGVIAVLSLASLISYRLEPAYIAISLAIIISDYSGSQAFPPHRQAIARTLVALSAIALPFTFVGYIAIRICASLAILAWAMEKKAYPEEEELWGLLRPPKKKVLAVALSNVVYFVPLIIIGNAGMASAKTAYLTYAIGAACLLRLIDFEIKRGVSGENARLSAAFYGIAGACAITFFLLGYLFDWRYLGILGALPALVWLRRLYLRVGWQ